MLMNEKLALKAEFSSLPVAPNLLRDTKNFKHYPLGLVNGKSNSGGPWRQLYRNHVDGIDIPKDASSSISASVVSLNHKSTAIAAKLYDEDDINPWGDLKAFLTTNLAGSLDTFFGQDVSALIFDLENYNVHRWLFVAFQGCPKFTSWHNKNEQF